MNLISPNLNSLHKVRNSLQSLPHQLYWNISAEIGKFFLDFVIQTNIKNILEFGTSNGYSGLWFAEGIATTQGHLWTVESHDGRYTQAVDNFLEAGVTNFVTQIKGHAPEILDNFPEVTNLDLIFLDATKSEYPSYLQRILPLLSQKGVVVADNIASHWDRHTKFIEDASSLNKYIAHYWPDLGSGMIFIVPEQNYETTINLIDSLTQKKGQRLDKNKDA